jgi:AraC-like DNA-binding protein
MAILDPDKPPLLQHSELSIVEIAAQTAFCDQSYLTRICKRIMGITPKQLMQWRSGSDGLLERL